MSVFISEIQTFGSYMYVYYTLSVLSTTLENTYIFNKEKEQNRGS